MRWRPSISVWRSKSGAPASPTSSLGFAIAGLISGTALLAGIVLLAKGALVGVFPMIGGAAFFKDVWAWFAAGPEERAEFLDRVSIARESAPLALRNPEVPASPMMAGGASLVLLGACAALVRLRGPAQVLALAACLYVGGFSLLCWRDVLRARKTRR